RGGARRAAPPLRRARIGVTSTARGRAHRRRGRRPGRRPARRGGRLPPPGDGTGCRHRPRLGRALRARRRACRLAGPPGPRRAGRLGHEMAQALHSGAEWLLDMGPGEALTRLNRSVLRGQGVGVVAAATRGGLRNLFTPGAAPTVERPWTAYQPKLISLPDGSVHVETSFTRLTGTSPILLAGMTPTTVDPEIVAAAANAGHWAELA